MLVAIQNRTGYATSRHNHAFFSNFLECRCLHTVLILVSAMSFLAYGSACFVSAHMTREFARYQLGSQRTLVGGLQLCAAVGLLAGWSQPWLGRMASAGLAVMMLVAVGVRVRIKDTPLQTIPALFYLALNAYLCLAAY